MTLKRLLQGLTLFAACCFLVWQLIPSDNLHVQAKTEQHVPDWFGHDVSVTDMDEAGHPKRHIAAKAIFHYAKSHTTDLFDPEFTLYQADKAPWHLSGAKGRTFHGDSTQDIERIDLWQNVLLEQREKSGKATTMETSTIAIFPDQDFAETDQNVMLMQPGHTLTGQGMRAHFDSQTLELFNRVRSEHAKQPRG